MTDPVDDCSGRRHDGGSHAQPAVERDARAHDHPDVAGIPFTGPRAHLQDGLPHAPCPERAVEGIRGEAAVEHERPHLAFRLAVRYSMPSGPRASPERNWRTNWLSELN